MIVAGQFGFVGWSDDGINWSTQTVGNGIFQAAVYGDEAFCSQMVRPYFDLKMANTGSTS